MNSTDGRKSYPIREFAEAMERCGNTYMPEQPREGDVCDTYEIYQLRDIVKSGYAFRPYDEAKGSIKASDYHRVYAGMLAPNVSLDTLMRFHSRDTLS
ncbi:MAG: hypothetical protein J6N15_00925 [Ruminiclostridium sp.]|nr:hypothetical protein [Ruminiclostridium sp.]